MKDNKAVVCLLSREPHTALTSVYQVALGLVGFRQRLLVVAQVYKQLVTVHPVVIILELLNYLLLNLLYCHNTCFCLRSYDKSWRNPNNTVTKDIQTDGNRRQMLNES